MKGPTDRFCARRIEASAAGIARAYDGVLDGVVADDSADGLRPLALDTLMQTDDARRRVAAATLEFARLLAR